jgi:hypothetical protein
LNDIGQIEKIRTANLRGKGRVGKLELQLEIENRKQGIGRLAGYKAKPKSGSYFLLSILYSS